ncbi:MAG: thiamine pyrophosphate-dependent dehydrogenase E1 component subunit alpha [Candidatus Omnitrophota bacterium]|jgi:pyruvate dehydrogenase E1 component alpha subunit
MRKDLSIELYRKMYLIRSCEENIRKVYCEDEMKTPMHMSMGAEAINAGVCQALNKDDQVFGTYRSHALYLAKTGNIYNFFAEMYGKNTALLKGKGGSMHLCDPQKGFMGTSAIVASSISVAVGAAFANKVKGNGKVVAVFFGDGATDEGTFWESINVAALMKIPVIFICEDNGLAVHTSAKQRKGYKDITKVIGKFNCSVFKDDTTKVEQIYDLAAKAIKSARSTNVPCFIQLKYYRYLEHVGINEDFDSGYRSRNEFADWYKKDPIILQRARLKTIGVSEKAIQEAEKEIDRKIVVVMKKVKYEPFAQVQELYEEVLE